MCTTQCPVFGFPPKVILRGVFGAASWVCSVIAAQVEPLAELELLAE